MVKTTGLVIHLSKEDNLLLKKHKLYLEELGIKRTLSELASEMFGRGLYAETMKK
jgi:hypothetical protein